MLKLASIIYGWVITQINQRYDRGIRPSISFNLPVIVVGNLSAGGSGKTPHVAYLAKMLKENGFSVGILSRGCGRKTKGLVFGTEESTAQDIGDEPLELLLSLKAWQIPVIVCEDRAYAIPFLVGLLGEKPVILMDDGFQHRKVKPSFSIILTPWHKPITQDILLPLGRLREPVTSLIRAHALIVSKCPATVSEADLHYLVGDIANQSQTQLPWAASAMNMELIDSNGQILKIDKADSFVLATGIVNPQPIYDWLITKGRVVAQVIYKDHHNYSRIDITNLITKARQAVKVAVTQKDWVKIKPLLKETELSKFVIVQLSLVWLQDHGALSAALSHVKGWYSTGNN